MIHRHDSTLINRLHRMGLVALLAALWLAAPASVQAQAGSAQPPSAQPTDKPEKDKSDKDKSGDKGGKKKKKKQKKAEKGDKSSSDKSDKPSDKSAKDTGKPGTPPSKPGGEGATGQPPPPAKPFQGIKQPEPKPAPPPTSGAPVQKDPMTDADGKPATPVVDKPAAPVVEKPITPGADEPVVPATGQPSGESAKPLTPPAQKPAEGAGVRPGGPVTTLEDPPLPKPVTSKPGGTTSTEKPGAQPPTHGLPGDKDEPKAAPGAKPNTSDASGSTTPGGKPLPGTPVEGAAPASGNGEPAESSQESFRNQEHLDAEQKTYDVISMAGDYATLLDEFGRQSGLTPTGDIPSGQAFYPAPASKQMSWQEAFRRVKTAIWQADVLNRRTIIRDGDYLVVLSVNDYWRQMPPEYMYTSVEEMRAADPHDDELVYVQYTMPVGTAANLELLRSFVPDYARIAPVAEGSSVIGIYAKVSDIKKYLTMSERFLVDVKDPRRLEHVACKHILPSQAVETIDRLIAKPGKTPARPSPGSKPGASSRPSQNEGLSLSVGEEPESIFMPNDDRKEILAYALPLRLEEFKQFLADLDIETEQTKRTPVVIAVEHADAAELARTIENILDAEEGKGVSVSGAGEGPAKPGASKSSANSRGGSTHGGVVILPMADWNQLVVIGPDDGISRVRDLVEMFDQPAGEVALHVVEIKHKTPSFIVNLLMNYDQADGSPVSKAIGGAPKGPKASPSSAKFNPDDENGKLYILCAQREWEVYQELIQQLDIDDGTGAFTRIELQHIDPADAIERVNQFLGSGGGAGPQPRGGAGAAASGRKMLAGDRAILVYGAGASELEHIRQVVGVLDQPSEQIEKTFVLEYAEPQTIIGIIEAMVLQSGGGGAVLGGSEGPPSKGRPPSRGSSSSHAAATLYPLDNRLLVKASATTMEKIEAVVKEFDVPPVEGTETRVYEFAEGTDVQAMADTLQQVIPAMTGEGGGAPAPAQGRGPGRGPGAGRSGGPQFIPQASAGKLIVIAEKAVFPKIDEMIDHLKVEGASVRAMRHVPLKKAQPKEIATTITAMMRSEPGGGVVMGGGAKKGGGGGGSFFIDEAPGGHAVVMHGAVAELDQAQKWIEQLDTAALTGQQVKLYHINNADPKQLVDLIINVIDSGAGAAAGPGGKAKAPKAPATPKGKESSGGSIDDLFGPSEEPEWESSRTYVSKDLYLQADYWEKTILVVTSPAKLDEIGALIEKLDPSEGDSPINVKPEPYTLIYELTYADAFDASLDIDTYLEIWGDNQPTVSYDDEQNTLIIRHPRPQVLDEVEKVIRTIIDRPKDIGDLVLEKRIIPVPINYPVMDAAQGLKVDTGKKLTVEIKGSAEEDKEYGISRVVPRAPAKSGDADKAGEAAKEGAPSADASKPKGSSGCVLPSSLSMGAASRVMIAAALVDDEDPRSGKRKRKAQEAQDEKTGKKDRKDSKRDKTDEADADPANAPDGAGAAAAPSADGDGDIKQTPPDAEEDPKRPGMTDTSVEDDPFLSSLAQDQSHIRTVTRDEAAIAAGEPGTMEEIKVWVDPVTNTIVVEGTTEDVKKIEEMVAELVKGQPTTKPDIRVYRVKYIDPVLAKDIIEEMFGAGSRNMANVMRQQQQQAAAAAARAAAARGGNVPGAPNARGGGSGGGRDEERGGQPQIIPGLPGQPGRPGQQMGGEDGGQQNQNQQFLQQMTQQQSAAEIKVYANPRDRTLVFRAPTGLYPAILELLATVDQPQEVTSTFKIFTLKKLQAEDAEKKLRSFLNLDEKPKGAEERLRDIEAMGGQMPEPVRDSQGNEITPNQIRITSNPMANTIIAMAPPEALDYIGKLIEGLESFEMPERLVEWIPLANSLAGEVVDMLDKHFAEDKSAAPGATGKKGAAMPATGGKTNVAAPPPSFLPYTRLNVVVVRATDEQMKEVKEVIAKLDVPPEGSQYESVQITCADAGALAQQLGQMFGAAAEGGKGKGAGTTSGAKFFASGEGNMLFYSVPNSIKPEVLATIEKIDQQQCLQQEVRIIELKFGTPSQVAEAVNMAYGGGGGKTAKKGGASGGRIVVAGHDPTRRLFVAAPNETAFQEVAALVQKLDVPTDLKFGAYPLKHLNARAAMGLMQGLIQQYGIRPGRDSEKFAVDADEVTNSLIVLGGPQTHAFVEEAIKTFDTEERRVGNVVTVIYQLKQASATELAKNIMATHGGKSKDGAEVKAEANQTLNALLVTASEKMQKQINETIIIPMDGMTPPGLLSEIIKVEHVHPDLLAEKIRAQVNEQLEGKKLVGQKGNAMGTTVVITSDPDLRQLLVLADQENMEFIKSRVALLDTPETSLKEGLITKKYPVQWGDPNVLKAVIDEWTATRTGKGKTGKQQVQTSARDLVMAYVDWATSSLIITASSENHERIVSLLKEIDVDTGLGSQREVVFLKNANAAELQQAIAPALAKSGGGNKRQPGQQLTVTAVPQLNALLVQGGPKDIDETKQLIAKLDLPPNEDTGVIIKVYPLQFLDPQFVVNMVNQAFAKTSSKRPEDAIKAAWTPPSNLIVGASNENHLKISALLKELDVESSAQRQIHTIKLTYASATDLAQNLSQLIQNTQQKKKTDVQPMYITGETGTNSLIVYANEVEMKWVEELLTKLDVAEVTSGRTIKSFQLTYADPNSVAQAITQVFGQSAPGGGKKNPQDQVVAFPEYGSRSVIVATSPRMLEDVKRLVAELDTSEGADRPIRVVAIKNVDPEGIQQVLQDLFSGGANPFGGGRGMRGGGFFFGGSQATGGMVIALVPGTNNIVVRASEEEFTKIMDVINQIDVDLAKKQDIRIFLLKNINAQEAQEALQSYLERPGAGSSMSSMFRGRGGSSRGALTGDARVTVLASSNGLVVTADREAIDGIAAVIQQLDTSAEGPNKPRIIKVEHANVADIEPMVTDLFLSDVSRGGGRGAPSTPKPIVVADPQLNALIVRAADTDFEAIKEIVAYLDKADRVGATFKIIPVPSGFGVADMAAQISDAINKGQQGQSSSRGSSKATSVTITPNARTHSLIVTGAPTLFPQVEQMVEQLASMGPPGGVATKIIPVKTMSLEDVQKIIELLKQQEEGQSSGSTRRR